MGWRSAQSWPRRAPPPHLLVMSATPIPRTLALIVYGDLDVSILDELPAGRRKVKTYAVSTALRPRVEAFMEKQLEQGRQVYVVCPMVEDASGERELSDVKSYAARLSRRLAPYTVAFLHGRMKNAEKEAVMARFAAGDIHVLGVDHRHRGGGGCAQRLADGGGKRREVRPVPAPPAAGQGAGAGPGSPTVS